MATEGVRAVAGRAYGASRSVRTRLRFTGALVLLVVPLLAAAWAFGNYAAGNERTRTDIRLGGGLQAARSEYALVITEAQLRAMKLATQRRVQRALRDRDRVALAQLARAHPNVEFLVGARKPKIEPGVVRRSAQVAAGNGVVGSVVVDVPLDHAVLTRIAHASGDKHEIAVAVRDGRIVAASSALSGPLTLGRDPSTVTVGGNAYRALGAQLAPRTSIGILAPNDAIDDAAASIRAKILLVGVLILGIVMVLAYALAPALARARVEQQQRAIAERVLAHVADGVLLIDQHGVVRFWNRAAEMITGLTADRVLDAKSDEAIPGWEEAAQLIPVGDADDLEAGATSATVPVEIDAQELWLAASGVRFDEGTVYTFRDISEDERLDKEKADFVATVSHELRTPLASVYGAAITLRHRFAALDLRRRDQLLQLLAEQANRLSSIIDELLLASRLASRLDSERLIAHDQFDADEVARVVVQAALLHAPAEIQIELSTPPWVPYATGDRDKVGQVLSNLVENAVKYSPGGGRIDVVVEQDGQRVRFEVRDEGLGIPLDEQERIFKKFYRLDPDQTRGIGGTGLGLYICRELVHRMGGELQVSSMPGRGSTFWFDLPLAKAVDRVAASAGSA
jgi:two-component system phosphate regulon sensor histidine kinase PhoR